MHVKRSSKVVKHMKYVFALKRFFAMLFVPSKPDL
jgi:hypothetical protein